ncbi:ABC-F family ATP-binding cassette domain-containing protein [Macrococcus equipercicus]|uniref:ABC-F family ATP-binding cassette domain-containing protein n=1 Tax=Macrococcus equipercicus TaxID=69967 RepID=A0ABQ6RB07_9STAP|nr:ABC-F family ATP-binding cassette domain-containing protein [Macrococcus equipercicus]KAA1042423.1 ABC-F family ATP-binding cassette domain-containing protein [Macrococcus equipercicus]
MEAYKIEKLMKQYGDKTIFHDVGLSIAEGEKVALVGINGTGKSALLKCIAEIEPHDGEVTHPNHYKISYAAQDPVLSDEDNALANVMDQDSPVVRLLNEYEAVIQLMAHDTSEAVMHRFNKLQQQLDAVDGFSYQAEARTILTKLGIMDHTSPLKTMSGGQQKRVALARTLLEKPDLLLLDEPTNHLDFESIAWLIQFIKSYKKSVLVVTHDRYFLNETADHIIELRNGRTYQYPGNYDAYIAGKAEEEATLERVQHKEKQLYKQELAWMRKGAKARSTKQQARIERFKSIEDKVAGHISKDEMAVDLSHQRLGKQVFELENIGMAFNGRTLFDSFSTIVQTTDRIGIVGENGTGKSTLLNILAMELENFTGHLKVGQTVKVGYYKQSNARMNEQMRVIDFLREKAEEATQSDGTKISVTQLLERFLFPSSTHGTLIHRLSGGEKKRLYLLSILIEGPNVLLLDEPTNDLDTETLTILEHYLSEFSGAVITVSHDRYFLDKVVNKYWYLHDSEVETLLGEFDDYLTVKKDKASAVKVQPATVKPRQQSRISYKEKRRFEQLGLEIESLELQLESVDAEIAGETINYERLNELTAEREALTLRYDESFIEWSDLAERME